MTEPETEVTEETQEEITLFDLATGSGFSYEWFEEEIIVSVAALGMSILEEENALGVTDASVKFTVPGFEEGDSDIEIIIRRAAAKKRGTLH